MARKADPKAAEGRLVISDFQGFEPNVDPHDILPGSSVQQINAMSWRPGELRVRPGYKVVQFDTE